MKKNEQWISAQLGVSVQPSAVEAMQELLVKYQPSLPDWEVVVERDERESAEGELYQRVALKPNQQLLSAKQLLKLQPALLEAAKDFCKQLASRAQTEVFHDPFSGLERPSMTRDELEGYWCLAFKTRGVPYTNVLTYTFSSSKRVAFDQEHPKLSKELFGETVEELVKGYQLHPTFWQQLLRGRNYVDALTRSRRRLLEWYSIDYDSFKN